MLQGNQGLLEDVIDLWGAKVKRKKRMREREPEGQQAVHSSVMSRDGGQGKHPMQLTMHSCAHTKPLLSVQEQKFIQLLPTTLESQMQAHDCIMFTNFLQNLLRSYGLYYSHSEPDDKLL